ncbi:MAG: protein-L-isoaspartate(D-aspartate) O-methyltransferase [Planctomycetaceae bacterium]|nr:protein-L-isoaspartate(D-aspartate) O-methyltransferase [Planctomycetaceae bacterium]
MDWRTEAQRLAVELRQRGIADPAVLRRIADVPRHAFVAAELRAQAYCDRALGIDAGQTISQPYIVALMTEAACVTPQSRVLEIGTGSGYQGAILAGLCGRLVTIERIPLLAERAQHVWRQLGLHHIISVVGDGSLGWPEGAPYDAILVTAGAPAAPQALLAQLADGGRLVIPVGNDDAQELVVFQRQGSDFRCSKLCDCRFVKLLGAAGWPVAPGGSDCESDA